MKVLTKDLMPPALDWAVEVAEEMTVSQREFQPSTNWSQGGPIIERKCIEILHARNPNYVMARTLYGKWVDGPTPLIAAMRCYVASRLGEEVEVPEELLP